MNKYLKQLIGVLILIMVVYGAYQFVYAQHPKDDGNIVSKGIKKTSIESKELKNENFQSSSGNDAKKGLSNENNNEKDGLNAPKERSQINHSQNNAKDIKVFLNNKEIKLKESEINLEFSHENIPITSHEKTIFAGKYNNFNNTQNGKFYGGLGSVYKANDERVSSNHCIGLSGYDCAQEMGLSSISLLEDGEGFVSVCESQFVKIYRMKDNKFDSTGSDYWEIISNRNDNSYYFGRNVGLTQDGKYLFVSVKEDSIKIRKYDLYTKKLVLEKSLDVEHLVSRISPSPYSDIVLIGNGVYNKDLKRIKSLQFDEMQDGAAYPRFFITNGRERVLVKGQRCLWIFDLNDDNKVEKISTENSDIIDWFQVTENKLLFQIKTEKNTFNLIELNLDNLLISFEGKIMKSTKEYKKGGSSTIIKIDNTSHKTYNYLTKLN